MNEDLKETQPACASALLAAGGFLKGQKRTDTTETLFMDKEYVGDIYYEGRFLFSISISKTVPDAEQEKLCHAIFEAVRAACR